MSEYLNVAVAVLATAVLLVIQHWIVLRIHPGPWPDVVRYSLGSAGVLCGFAVWGILAGDLLAVTVLALIYGLAGGLIILMHLAEQASVGEGHREEAAALRDVVRNGQE